jgi:hypothetical protein
VRIAIPQTLAWKGGLLPANADEATVTIAADDADLIALNPFLAAAGITVTTGRWTGEASVSFKDGQPVVRSVRTHSLRGVTLEQAGRAAHARHRRRTARQLRRRDDRARPLQRPLRRGRDRRRQPDPASRRRRRLERARRRRRGHRRTASQPNWEDMPVDKLKGIRVSAKASVERASGKTRSWPPPRRASSAKDATCSH